MVSYYVTELDALAISGIYFLFNQLLVLGPFLLFLVVGKSLNKEGFLRRSWVTINWIVALVIGWGVVLYCALRGHLDKSLIFTMYASGAGTAATILLSVPAWIGILRRNK